MDTSANSRYKASATADGSWPSLGHYFAPLMNERVAVGVFLAFLASSMFAGCVKTKESSPNSEETMRIFVFSRTQGFRHESIERGVAVIEQMGAENGFQTEHGEDQGLFTRERLGRYKAVVWLNTTGNVLDADQQTAFEDYIRRGGAYVGVHSAADTEYDWPWYGQLLGGNAWFNKHPPIQAATLQVVDQSHPSTRQLPISFSITDEWYNFKNNPQGSVNVLITIDEASYDPGAGAMGNPHPIAWYHEFDGGRAWYSGLGHREVLYDDTDFGMHLLGGLLWAMGAAENAQ